MLLDHPERMLNFRADVCLGPLDQILRFPIWYIRQVPAFAGSRYHAAFGCLTCRLRLFGDALLAGVAVNHFLISMQQFSD